MNYGVLQVALYIVSLMLVAKPLGEYMARVYLGSPGVFGHALSRVEVVIYRLSGVDADQEMHWKHYAVAVLVFNFLGAIVVYMLQRLQGLLPMNPDALPAVSADSAFNTAVSFATNTNWQGYAGEATMSYLTQMAGLTVQNFVSAATGMATLIALVRGFARKESSTIGNFWVDLTRSVLYVLLPLSLILAIVLVGQGVVQTFDGALSVPLAETAAASSPADGSGQQILSRGPAASQVAIKQLGTNGGGFFNVNSAHPFENPTPLSNFLEALAILLIPAALCHTFGAIIGDRRQGWAMLAAMTIVFAALAVAAVMVEQTGNPTLAALGVDVSAGNTEGKEARFSVAETALWAVATTAASNGSVNGMHDSLMPLGGLIPMWLMQLGEVIFGGVGSGLYGMIVFALVAVFVAGLMIGRTPEYLGKKIEAYEMKMATLVILVPPLVVLLGTAIAVLVDAGRAGILNPGPHGFSEILYAFSSAGNNNGSAFAGLSANTPFYNIALGLAMLIARYWLIIPVLAIAGSLAAKRRIPAGLGTLPTHTPLFVGLLIGTVIVVGALTFIPALAFGPVVEHLQLLGAQR
ncbi:MAG: potassium-transporting ATPase subunit KdpA [Methylotetracoccus sp.]